MRSEKVQILTVLPRRFGASNYMVCKAKELVKLKGILSTPNPRHGHALAVETTDLVQRFYESDEVSRIMPGKKDYVSVRQLEKRVHIQKRLYWAICERFTSCSRRSSHHSLLASQDSPSFIQSIVF